MSYKHGSQEPHINLDAVINRCLESNGGKVTFSEAEVKDLLNTCRNSFMDQSLMLQLTAPVKIVGSIHGHLTQLINIFKMSGFPSNTNYLFLGNYVDRGPFSLECLVLLLCYRAKYPQNFFMLRGQHELSYINRSGGFYDECNRKLSVSAWKDFNEVFTWMPVCATIQRKIFCVHGGITPELQSVEILNKLNRPIDEVNHGVIVDLIWSDPDPQVSGWQENERGISYTFGSDCVSNFLHENKFDLIVRSHQLVPMGYEFLFGKHLVTLFSVPDFMDYGNCGAIMSVEQKLACSFEIIKPAKNKKTQFRDKARQLLKP